MKTRIAAAVLLLCAAAASAAPAKKKDKPADAAPPAEEAADDAKPAADDAKPGAADGKKRVEAYLAARTKKLADAHAARLEFSARENLLWEEFWGKVRDARKTFELRTARQAVDLFSTLETLDAKDHASTVADFEKLRGTMVKSFEAQQKQKMVEFFAAREARWKQFADAQEKDRVAFAAEAEAAWQADKDFLRSVYAPSPAPSAKN
ncbi:MAG: hypothetical protein HY079_10800 [Elusimicrobia bacterium]|nr:hypothetical protein [Elusimicrobiota bacterium]